MKGAAHSISRTPAFTLLYFVCFFNMIYTWAAMVPIWGLFGCSSGGSDEVLSGERQLQCLFVRCIMC